eukprot:s1032_g9.t3
MSCGSSDVFDAAAHLNHLKDSILVAALHWTLPRRLTCQMSRLLSSQFFAARGHAHILGSVPRTPRTLGQRPVAYDGEASGSEPTVYNAERGYADDICGQTACWTTLPQLSGRSVSPKPTHTRNVPDSSIAEPVTADASETAGSDGQWAFSTPMRCSRGGRIPRNKPDEPSRVRRAADELLESVRRRALEAKIAILRHEPHLTLRYKGVQLPCWLKRDHWCIKKVALHRSNHAILLSVRPSTVPMTCGIIMDDRTLAMVQGLFAMVFGATLLTLLSEAQVFPRRCFCHSGPGAYGLCEAWQDCRTVISFLMGALVCHCARTSRGEDGRRKGGLITIKFPFDWAQQLTKAEIERLRGELASAEASKQKLQAGEAAEAEAGAEAARLLREARVEVNRLKAALQRQGHFERTKEVESHRQAFEKELRTAREDAARKREELQHLNQVQQEQLLKERDAERRLRLEAETRREAVLLQLHELQEADRLRHDADVLLGELREEIRKLQGLLHLEQSARQAAEQRQSTVEGLQQQTQEENEQLRQNVCALSQAQQETQKINELLNTERSLRKSAEEQCKNLQADLGRCRRELETGIQERKVELQARQEAELRSRTAEDSCITLRNEMLGLEARVRDLRSQLESKGSASETLRRQVESLQAAEDSWAQERASLQAQVTSQSSGIKSHSMEIESLQQNLISAQQQNESGKQEREVLQRQLDQAKQEQASLRRQLDEAKATLSDFDGLQQRLSKERDHALNEAQEVQAKLQQQKSEAEVLTSQLSQVQAGSVSKSDLEEVQRQMESLRKERDMFQGDVEHLRQSIRERRSAESSSSLSSLSSMSRSLRAALQEEQNSSRILHQELDEVKKLRSFSVGSQDGMSAEPSPHRPRAGVSRSSSKESLVQKIRQSQQITAPTSKVVDMTRLEPRDINRGNRAGASPSSSYETTSEDMVDLTGAV